ncbi:voltage-dependent T-type calcium channel subunit alpha-1H-like isoform X2 [Planococcus citri]|uniref:voltage-dependent T-type calcium channel subunit alpha-1H-like isoform X2 n=1 Tax=Planococcus citri TaxID=170843 RepID=UPI0031F784CA
MEYRFPGNRHVINVDSEIVEDMSNDYENEDDEGEEDEESDDEEEEDDDVEDEEEDQLPYPGFVPISFKYLDQMTRPRSWCLAMITNPWFERVSMLVILLNCITLGMYQPCVDDKCITNRCKILQMFDDFIFAFFALEMTVKMIAMGVYGKGTYLADSWNRLDFFIVLAGGLEYCLNVENINLTAIRTIRVLRPLRAINRIPSMRILVMLLLDTLPMLGNVLLLCFFVFFIFGIIGVQLWEGILRQRCFLKPIPNVTYPRDLPPYYQYKDQDRDYICSQPDANGMHTCSNIPPMKFNGIPCNETAKSWSYNQPSNGSCVNWNQYYTDCKSQGQNPFQGTISFDNIGLAWVAIFVVISLEGWVDIMYYVQDAHSFWDWIYFVLLIVIGSFFMINLCLVVIATQFSETKKREMERMRLERARYHSTSTLASSTNNSEPNSCYAEMIKYIAHIYRRGKRRLIKRYRVWRYTRQQKKEAKRISKTAATTLPLQHLSSSAEESSKNKPESREDSSCQREDSIRSQPTPAILRVGSVNSSISRKDLSDHDQASSKYITASPSKNSTRRQSNVVFSDVVLLHSNESTSGETTKNVCSSEKMTQAGDGNIWQIIPNTQTIPVTNTMMSCQELLALSGALSAALPTGQLALDSLFNSLSQSILSNQSRRWVPPNNPTICFVDQPHLRSDRSSRRRNSSDYQNRGICNQCCLHNTIYVFNKYCLHWCSVLRKLIKRLVNHKRFQQGILLAILINTLSMGIEYHNQPQELTVIVEISNIAFSLIFAAEMILKIIADGVFGYISNGFNVFDGVIVILSIIELGQSFFEGYESSNSGLSVLRTFRLLRILKLVRFMPNLRRQLFVMLRTMDNVAVFFSLLILFIFIFSILGMYLFGGKFCMYDDGLRECNCEEIVNKHPLCHCDRKHFNNVLWATVTVFQILTQEDWNIVLFNGMEKTSHWAALYFVALMTFGNYVLFNLLVAILVEGFQSERNERREREQRELARQARRKFSQCCSEDYHSCCSHSDHDTFSQENYHEDFHRISKDYDDYEWEKNFRSECNIKCNLQKEHEMNHSGAQYPPLPIITHTAATPQDSPNNTLDVRGFNNQLTSLLSANSSILSIDSIDYSSASQSSFDKMSRRPIQMTINTFIEEGIKKDNSNSDISRKDSKSFNFQRRCSWKLSRPSFKRKSSKQSLTEDDDQDVILNNNNHLVINPCLSDHSHCNGGVLRNNAEFRKNTNLLSPHHSIASASSFQSAQVHLAASNTTAGSSPVNPPFPFQIHGSHLNISHLSDVASVSEDKSKGSWSQGQRKHISTILDDKTNLQTRLVNEEQAPVEEVPRKLFYFLKETGVLKERAEYSLWIFPPEHPFRRTCEQIVAQRWFDNLVLFFIALNCITLAMERPNIPPISGERKFLAAANYVFTVVFGVEMFIKVVAAGMFYGQEPYFKSGWNIMDGSLVSVSIVDILMSLISDSSPRIFGILRVFRLLRSLRPLRVINRAPGLKLVVQTLLSSLRPIGNIVLICCTFFIIFGILGVQLFKGTFFHCEGPNIKNIHNKTECLRDPQNVWVNRKYNFDDLGKALMSLFVLSSRDGWVNIMYTGLDAVGVDQQPIENFSEWRLLYFISFILLVGFFVLNMFVGVVVENFHRCREEQEKEERVRRLAKRAKQLEKKRRRLRRPPYYAGYGKYRLLVHNVVTSKYFDLAIAAVIGLNVITMAMEFYMMPKALTYALKIFNYFFTAVFVLESLMKLVALGIMLYVKDRWNLLDVGIVILSIVGIALEEVESKIIPINPTIIRVMRVMRIARVLKLLKMAKGIRALLDTVMQALPQVGNLGLLFFLLFFIFAALGVELFGRLECNEEHPCQGLGEHAHFSNFGMAFLTLFRVATGDNWNGIMKDTLRDECDDHADCVRNCCVSAGIAPMFFVIFVLMAQFVLVNVVVAVLMKHLEESHKQMEDEMDMDEELEREIEEEEDLCVQLALERDASIHKPLTKVLSLPADFTFTSCQSLQSQLGKERRGSVNSWGGRTVDYGRRRRLTLGPGLIVPSPTDFSVPYYYGLESERQQLIRRVASDTTTEKTKPKNLVDQSGCDSASGSGSYLQVPNLNLCPESRYERERDSDNYVHSPIIKVTPPSLHSSVSLSNVSTVVAQIETNIPADTENTKPNISANKKDNLDVRIEDEEKPQDV